MEPSQYRILLVDDYEPWRQFLCSTIQKHPQFKIIGQADNGLQAVQQSQELQPDLVLLDIGMPELNGIEAARRIRKASPETKILFVSENRSKEIADEALRAGGNGYIIKSHAGGELLPAIEAVLQGRRFVSASLPGPEPHDAAREHTIQLPQHNITPTREHNEASAHRHEAGFYSDDRLLLDDVTQFVGTALKAGDAAIVVATESHRVGIVSRLRSSGLDIESAIREGRYIALDVVDCLPTFLVGGMPDPIRFVDVLGNLILTAKATTTRRAKVVLYGEGSPLLWAQGNPEAAIQTEKLTNQLVKAYEVDVLCGYLERIPDGVENKIFQQICMQHSAVHTK